MLNEKDRGGFLRVRSRRRKALEVDEAQKFGLPKHIQHREDDTAKLAAG